MAKTVVLYAHWVYSITTRIKTPKNKNRNISPLIEYIPLQQGLRPHCKIFAVGVPILIEYIPLQQGLRLMLLIVWSPMFILIEYIPLQQGLRQYFLIFYVMIFSHWVYSITTRIKTRPENPRKSKYSFLIEYIPLQQGLRQLILFFMLHFLFLSLSIFHYNKD